MATVQPPTTIHEWRGFVALCERSLRTDWLPSPGPSAWWTIIPENSGETEGFWHASAEGHPLQGTFFCWRCIAQAQGFSPRVTSHISDDPEVICWQATRNQASEHPEPDAGTTEPGPEAYVRPTHVTDTGTSFYERKA